LPPNVERIQPATGKTFTAVIGLLMVRFKSQAVAVISRWPNSSVCAKIISAQQ
jgi:hypothetical protein